MLLPILLCGFIGLFFGSFATVLIERWKQKKPGIILGRSECPSCGHRLSALELIPLVSYIIQKGRCKNCHTKIPGFYPISECIMAGIFLVLTHFSLEFGLGLFTTEHFFLLFLGFVTCVYVLYDIRYMEIPDQIMVPALIIVFLLLFVSIWHSDLKTLFFDRTTYTGTQIEYVWDHLFGAWILYSFLYVQILIPGGYYLLKRKKYKESMTLVGSYALFPLLIIWEWMKNLKATPNTISQDSEVELPSWIGGGDLRVALFIGLTLGTIHGIASFVFAYVLGSIFSIALLVIGKVKLGGNQHIPFGPFLGAGWIISIILYLPIIDYVNSILENIY